MPGGRKEAQSRLPVASGGCYQGDGALLSGGHCLNKMVVWVCLVPRPITSVSSTSSNITVFQSIVKQQTQVSGIGGDEGRDRGGGRREDEREEGGRKRGREGEREGGRERGRKRGRERGAL